MVLNNKKTYLWIKEKFIKDRLNADFYSNENIQLEKTINNNKNIYKNYKLKQISLKLTQGPNPQYVYVDTNYRCMKTKNLNDYGISLEDCSFISKQEFDSYKNYILEYGDILIGIKGEGSIGKSNIYLYNSNNYIFTREIGLIRLKSGLVNELYVSAFLRCKYGKKLLERGISGSSGQKTLNIEYIKNIDILFPEKKVQEHIGNKIKKAEELREEAKRLKKEAEELLINNIGIDKENINKQPDSKYVWVGDKYIYDRLDCQYYNTLYEEIETRLMKNKCKNLIDLCEEYSITVPYSTDFGVKSDENIYPMYRVKNIDEYLTNMDDLLYINNKFYDNNEKCRVDKNDILLSRVGSIGRASIYLNSEKATMGQNVTRIKLKNTINKYYFLCYINSHISRLLMKRETNAGLQPNLTNENIKLLKVPILNKNIQDEIGNKILQFINNVSNSKQLIEEAKQDVENLIEGNFSVKE